MNTLSLVEKFACLNSQDKDYLESLVDRFLTTPTRKGCDCHVLDPKKSDMIIWPSQNPKHKDDLIVKVTNQKFIGMPRIDKRGEKYWKVRDFYENEEREPVIASAVSPKLSLKEEIDLICRKPLSEQTTQDREKWAKWVASKKTPENSQTQENVQKEEENNHESTNH